MFSKLLIAGALFGAGLSGALGADLASTKSPPPPPPSLLPFFLVNDNTFSLSYQYTATDPGFPGTTAKKVLNFTHFDVWGYGTNFFTIDVLKSDSRDPASPCLGQFLGCAGATEIYGLFRSTFGFNEMFKTKTFSMGPLNDVSFEIGGDANTENNFLAPAKRDIVAGLEFTFGLPYKGHLNISPLYYKEWNHNSFLTPAFLVNGPVDGNTDFDGTWAIETNYSMDLGFLPAALPLTFSGYANFYGPKGTGISSLVPNTAVPKTVVEFNSQQKLSLDVGKMAFGPAYSHYFDVWVAYRYWQNKFGLDHTKGVCVSPGGGGCTEKSWVTGVSVTF
jgi:nucleoside-specific outer membrane channel protein Tsx